MKVRFPAREFVAHLDKHGIRIWVRADRQLDVSPAATPAVRELIGRHERAIRAELIQQAAEALADLRRRPRRPRRTADVVERLEPGQQTEEGATSG